MKIDEPSRPGRRIVNGFNRTAGTQLTYENSYGTDKEPYGRPALSADYYHGADRERRSKSVLSFKPPLILLKLPLSTTTSDSECAFFPKTWWYEEAVMLTLSHVLLRPTY